MKKGARYRGQIYLSCRYFYQFVGQYFGCLVIIISIVIHIGNTCFSQNTYLFVYIVIKIFLLESLFQMYLSIALFKIPTS
jgi:hypothetical protein